MSQLKFNHVFTILLLLSLLSAFVIPRKSSGLRAHVQGVFYPVAKPARLIATTLRGRMDGPKDDRRADDIVAENQRLKISVAHLSGQIDRLQALVAEGERIGDLAKSCKRVTVMGNDPATRDSLSVTGSFDASLLNQPVLYQGGMAGTFERVGVTGAQVRLVTDRSFNARGRFGVFGNDINGVMTFIERDTTPPLIEGCGHGVMMVKNLEYKEVAQANIGEGTWVVLDDKDYPTDLQHIRIGRVVSVKKRLEAPLWADVELRPEYDLMKLSAVMVYTRDGAATLGHERLSAGE